MSRKIMVLASLLLGWSVTQAQELFPSTEPASNMPAKSIGLRLANEGAFDSKFNRTVGEVMVGFNKKLMAHAKITFSNADVRYGSSGNYAYESVGLYAKYRFLSVDGVQQHFRMAAFGAVSKSEMDNLSQDLGLEGDNSGWQTGIIATQLIHKLALSATVSYAKAFENKARTGAYLTPYDALDYSLSSGYLLLPFVYKDYKQPNFNLYVEFLGRTALKYGDSYVDMVPAAQVIINSRTRIDLSYRFNLFGNIVNRFNNNMYLVRMEFNFFNAL